MTELIVKTLCPHCFEIDCACDRSKPAGTYDPQPKAWPQAGDQMLAGSLGRGPSGKLRNFGAMSDEKLVREARKIIDQGIDMEAADAVKAEVYRRGLLI